MRYIYFLLQNGIDLSLEHKGDQRTNQSNTSHGLGGGNVASSGLGIAGGFGRAAGTTVVGVSVAAIGVTTGGLASDGGADGCRGDGDLELGSNGSRLLDDPLNQTDVGSTTSVFDGGHTVPQVLGDLVELPFEVDTGRALGDVAVPGEVRENELVVLEDTVGEGDVVEEDFDSLLDVALELGLLLGVLEETVDQDGVGEGGGVLGVGPRDKVGVGVGDVDSEGGVKVLANVVPLVVLGGVAVETIVGLHLPVAVPVAGQVLDDHEAHELVEVDLLVNLGNGGIVGLDSLVPGLAQTCDSGGLLGREGVLDPRVVCQSGGVVGEGGAGSTVKEGTHLSGGLAVVEHGLGERILGDIVEQVEGTEALAVDEHADHVGLVDVGTEGTGNISVELLTDLGGILLHVAQLEEVAVGEGLASVKSPVPALLGVVLLLASTVDTELDVLC